MVQDNERNEMPEPHEQKNRRWEGPALIVVGLVIVAAGVLAFVAGEPSTPREYRTISRGLILGAAFGAYGVYLAARGSGARGTTASNLPPQPAAKTTAPATPPPPATTPAPNAASPATATPSAPHAQTPGAANTASAGTPATSVSLEGMLHHSDDAIATLRDIALHGRGKAGLGVAPELLARTGITTWHDAPADVTAGRLSRNGRWWLRTSPDDPHDYDLLVGIEAAVNLAEDLARMGATDPRRALAQIADLKPYPYDGPHKLETMTGGAQQAGEWQARLRIADFLENSPLPFRASFDLQTSVRGGLACVDVECPSPVCFSLVGEGPTTPAEEARAYALRLAVLAARGVLATPGITRAVVNCRTHDEQRCVLSADMTPAALKRLLPAVRSESLAQDLRHDPDQDGTQQAPLPADAALRLRPRADGWLDPVVPFCSRDDEALCPDARFREVELDLAPAPKPLVRDCGARRMCDLGINEKAGRVSAWNATVGSLGDTTQDAVAKLMRLRDSTADVTVAEACERTSKALVEGAIDIASKQELAVLFVDGGSLAQTLKRVGGIEANNTSTPDELASGVSELEDALSPISEMGVYLDDSDTVYRYFNSVTERVVYNRTVDDGGRRVRLVPDEYYAAHSTAARLLNRLGRTEEALPHAEELMRVAPVTTDASLGMVRCLEEQSRIFEAADLLKRALKTAPDARDMAICLYRLAYMEWRLGRGDLAVACYQRSIQLDAELALPARAELENLLETEDSLHRLPADELVPVLEAAGIPAGNSREAAARALQAAAACADAELFPVARSLTNALISFSRDDVLLDVERSLARP